MPKNKIVGCTVFIRQIGAIHLFLCVCFGDIPRNFETTDVGNFNPVKNDN
jgi:hypothetical protein